MTVENLKKLDRQMRQIQDPFGTGFLACRKLFEEWAERCNAPVHVIEREYTAWKWKK